MVFWFRFRGTNGKSWRGRAMRKIVFFVHTTLDGFIANANDELWERFPWGEDEMAFTNDFFRSTDTWVLGRKMYEIIVPWWSAVAAGTPPEDASLITARDQEFADLLKGMTKVVISKTLGDAGCERIVINDNVGEALLSLKQQPGKDILLSCGPGLLAPLADQSGLIDQYMIVVHPAVLGTGKHLFGDLRRELPLQLLEAKVFPAGCVLLRYHPSS